MKELSFYNYVVEKPAAKEAAAEKATPQEKRGEPFPFESLPEELQDSILSFVDVPTLGCLVRTSKDTGRLAKSDRLWAPHLHHLLEELFDDAFQTSCDDCCCFVTPISKRSQWRSSPEFRVWYNDCCRKDDSYPIQHNHSISTYRKGSVFGSTLILVNEFMEYPERFKEDQFLWLLENVSLREYYKQAGAYAYEGKEILDEKDAFFAFFGFAKIPPLSFDRMPNIQLFRAGRNNW